jgi:hypothetical protein
MTDGDLARSWSAPSSRLTRRRKSSVCTNVWALPIAEADDAVLGIV